MDLDQLGKIEQEGIHLLHLINTSVQVYTWREQTEQQLQRTTDTTGLGRINKDWVNERKVCPSLNNNTSCNIAAVLSKRV